MSVDGAARLPLGADDVHLWLVDYAAIDDPALHATYRGLLTPDELAQEPKFFFARDRLRYLVTRALVRSVLSRYLPVDPRDWVFSTNAYGCPHASNAEAVSTGVSFNLSHTHSLIALAVSRGRAVGVDVENHGAREVPISVADRYFSPREVADLLAAPTTERQYRFFEYWTFKESYIKARGMGLSLPLDGFGFRYPDPARVEIEIAPELEDPPQRWHFRQFRPAPEYLLALCVERVGQRPPTLTIRHTVPLVEERALALEVLRASE
jgi:4'-phosphopantetheinyl transferase